MDTKNAEPSVAILMSTYNGEKFLDEQLESIASQTYTNNHLIVRDDGSKDSSRKIIEKWKKHIQIIEFSTSINLGPAQSFMELARNSGQYDYYAFSDQDDVWDKDKIEVAINKLNDINTPALYFSRSRYIDANGVLLSEDRLLNLKYMTVESEIVCGYCPGCAMVFNKALMDEVRQQRYRVIPMHDMVFIMTALAVGTVVYDVFPRFSRRMHTGNVIGREGKNRFQKLQQSYRRWIKDSKNYPLDKFVEDFIENTKNKNPQYDMDEMKAFVDYKKSLISKIKIYKSNRFITESKRGNRSFKIRLILGLL